MGPELPGWDVQGLLLPGPVASLSGLPFLPCKVRKLSPTQRGFAGVKGVTYERTVSGIS